ncbi:MAG: cupin domain-containing protein [Thermoproteota archaeon]|nr:cupin domain-containing protein [Thermoproteota archaeon]
MAAFGNSSKSKFWIEKLQLSQHPEGGFYRETHRSDLVINFATKRELRSQNDRFASRSISSTIYYLLEGGQKSMFHRMKNSDEIWHFYTGSSLTLYVIDKVTRSISEFKLGTKPEKGELFQILIKRGSWFGAIVNDSTSYALVGCTVFPAFSFADFELANRRKLTMLYPKHKTIIEMLTSPQQ